MYEIKLDRRGRGWGVAYYNHESVHVRTYLKVVVEVLQVGLVGCQLVNADLTRFIKLGWNYICIHVIMII